MKLSKTWWFVRGLIEVIKINIKEEDPTRWLTEKECAEIHLDDSNSTRIAFEDFYQFWQLNPYRWHCRPFYAYYDEEVIKKEVEPELTQNETGLEKDEDKDSFTKKVYARAFANTVYASAYRLSDDKPLKKIVPRSTAIIRKGKIYVTFSATDLIIYQGWRSAVKASYRAEEIAHNKELDRLQRAREQALKDNTFMRLLKGVQDDINDTNDQALAYYEQASEYLEQAQEETNNE